MIEISVLPQQPLIETGGHNQYVNFDFWLRNSTGQKWQIYALQLRALDEGGNLLRRKAIGLNGISPAIHTLGKSELPPGGELYVFNPFHTFPSDLPIDTLHYTFILFNEAEETMTREVDVSPVVYQPQTDLALPLRGRVMVYDGHDFYAHHRRVDLTHPAARMLGIESNGIRYAYDFCTADAQGGLYQGDGGTREAWFGFGAPVAAPGAGLVVKAVNDQPDLLFGQAFDYEAAMQDPDLMEGNCVLIDHENGEFSALMHLQQGSVSVLAGDRVEQGQLLGRMGFSGDAGFWVHLHYELRNGVDGLKSEGLPAYFRDFRRVCGEQRIPVERDSLESGELIEA